MTEFSHHQIGVFEPMAIKKDRLWTPLTTSEVEMKEWQEIAAASEPELPSEHSGSTTFSGLAKFYNDSLLPEQKQTLQFALERTETGNELLVKAQVALDIISSYVRDFGTERVRNAPKERERILQTILTFTLSEIARPVVEEMLHTVGISPKELPRIVRDRLPEIGPRISHRRKQAVLQERLDLILRLNVSDQHKCSARNLMPEYQRMEMLGSLASFNDESQFETWLEMRRDTLRYARDFGGYIQEAGYPPLDQVAALYAVTAHPSIVLRDDKTC